MLIRVTSIESVPRKSLNTSAIAEVRQPCAATYSGWFGYKGDQVIEALRARLGKEVVLIGGDGFLPIPDLLRAAPSARGMYVTSAGVATHQLPAAGRLFLNEFAAGEPGGMIASGTYVLEAAQAAELLLAAIARSDGTRASVLHEVRKSRVTDGILGSFGFDRNGDMTSAPVTVYRVTGRAVRFGDLVADFRGATPDRTVRVPVALAR